MAKVSASFFQQSTCDLATQLLGCRFMLQSPLGLLGGRIVEVEAYLHRDDPASHSARGPSVRNRSMFGPPGCLYVYSIHNRWCMNIVTEECGIGAAILIRALQPELGISQMLHNRPVQDLRELTNGPGKLCQAMGISKLHDGCSLIDGDRMWLEKVPPSRKFQIQTSPRIGISQARELPLRYFVDGHRFVSGRAADHSMPRTWVWDEHKSSS